MIIFNYYVRKCSANCRFVRQSCRPEYNSNCMLYS